MECPSTAPYRLEAEPAGRVEVAWVPCAPLERGATPGRPDLSAASAKVDGRDNGFRDGDGK